MTKKKTNKPSLVLIERDSQLPKIKIEGDDEIALLIRSINEMGKNAKAKSSLPPEPPKAA